MRVKRFSDDNLNVKDGDAYSHRVIRSVLPVFDRERERPEHVGSCVLAEIDGHSFVLTAAHVIQEVRAARGRFTVAVGGQLLALLGDKFLTPENIATDVGVVPLRSATADVFRAAGAEFFGPETTDEAEAADGSDLLNKLAHTYFAVGFPASRSYSRVHHAERKINVRTYTIRLTLGTTYPVGLTPAQHVVLDYDPKDVRQDGKPANPPKLMGMSGGGLFRCQRRAPETTTKLVGILIEQHRDARIMVATRISDVAKFARAVIRRYPDAFL